MKNKIPEFLQKKLTIKGSAQTRFFSDEIKQFMIDYDKFYKWELNGNLTKIFKVMKMGISDLPKCKYKNCNKSVYLNWELKLTAGCSKEHSQKITYQNKYGVDSNLQLKSVQNKIKKTAVQKYGVEYPSQSNEIKEKMKTTNLKKYGTEYASQSDEIKKKVQETNLKNYGVINPFASDEIKDKIKQTNLKKYGTEYAMQNVDVVIKNQKNAYKYKPYEWNTGEISKVQGYEPIVLKELEDQGFKFNDIITSIKEVPHFWYEFNGSKHKYIPDFFIPKLNLIIEVKSEYTMNLHYERNLLKFQAAKDAGYDFKLEIR